MNKANFKSFARTFAYLRRKPVHYNDILKLKGKILRVSLVFNLNLLKFLEHIPDSANKQFLARIICPKVVLGKFCEWPTNCFHEEYGISCLHLLKITPLRDLLTKAVAMQNDAPAWVVDVINDKRA